MWTGYLSILGDDRQATCQIPRQKENPNVGLHQRDHGLILHAAAKADDGVVIVNLWPSKDGSEAAARDPRRLDTLADLGLTPDRFRRDHHDVVNLDLFRQI